MVTKLAVVVVYDCTISTQDQEAKKEIQFEVGLGYILKLCLKTTTATTSQSLWYIPIIPAQERQSQED
jgi:hypothetical protein